MSEEQREPTPDEFQARRIEIAEAFLEEIRNGTWEDFILVGRNRAGIQIDGRLVHHHMVRLTDRYPGDPLMFLAATELVHVAMVAIVRDQQAMVEYHLGQHVQESNQ